MMMVPAAEQNPLFSQIKLILDQEDLKKYK